MSREQDELRVENRKSVFYQNLRVSIYNQKRLF